MSDWHWLKGKQEWLNLDQVVTVASWADGKATITGPYTQLGSSSTDADELRVALQERAEVEAIHRRFIRREAR